MPVYAKYPIPHFLGKVSYPADTRMKPDGDTVHLFDPVLLVNGKAHPPKDGTFTVWVTGATKPKIVRVRGKGAHTYIPIRFAGIDAPEEHYRATAFKIKVGGQERSFPLNPAVKHEDRSQPLWSPATKYAVGTLTKAGWGLAALDSDVIDRYGRVLGYMYASDAKGSQNTYVTLELLKRGYAFPFLFESSGERIPTFLAAAKKAKSVHKGVWQHYQHKPLPYSASFDAPTGYTEVEPTGQKASPLCLPVAFRRSEDAHQLKGLSLTFGLQKYDAMRFSTGDVLPGDQYPSIPVDDLIWAPHSFV